MKRVYNLIVLCILLICQQNIVAQSYNLGTQKQSFAYETLYANSAQRIQGVNINTQSTQPMASAEEIQKCEQVHRQILRLTKHYYVDHVFKKYNNIYKYIPPMPENIDNLQKIQYVVISHLNSQGTAFPQIEKQLKNASSTKEEIQIFLSYYQE